VGITRPCTKANWLVKETDRLAATLHEAFHVARLRAGPARSSSTSPRTSSSPPAPTSPGRARSRYQPRRQPDPTAIEALVVAMETARRPVLYTGGGVINAGPEASRLLRELVAATNFPITSTLMGLGAYPASGPNWLGMLGMHGLYEANLAMHGCDLMINIGARFDDRITGRLDAFSPGSRKAHIDIDPSSINKVIRVDIPVVADVAEALRAILEVWTARGRRVDREALSAWHGQIDSWRAKKCLTYKPSKTTIKPQYALERLEALTKAPRPLHLHRGRPAPDVGRAVPGLRGPNRWMTSGGLGTMGYGFPASIGVQLAHPDALVINVAARRPGS
jgi:acetolactate synthase-1/2/3 large subunit